MHELIKGVHKVEIIANDFVAVGFIDTQVKPTVDHDQKSGSVSAVV